MNERERDRQRERELKRESEKERARERELRREREERERRDREKGALMLNECVWEKVRDLGRERERQRARVGFFIIIWLIWFQRPLIHSFGYFLILLIIIKSAAVPLFFSLFSFDHASSSPSLQINLEKLRLPAGWLPATHNCTDLHTTFYIYSSQTVNLLR